jgi:FMN phosphatase YigB (HAD superfamily)
VNEAKEAFFVLDLDRTLFDTVLNADYFLQAVRDMEPELATLMEALSKEYEARQQSYSMLETVLSQVGRGRTDQITQHYRDLVADKDLLAPGAHEVLALLEQHNHTVGYGIVTFGSLPEGQQVKLEAAGLANIPHLITTEAAKGAIIASWKEGDRYQLPAELSGVSTPRVVLVDDRLRSFEGLPDDARGYWLQPEALPTGDPLPRTIKIIRSLGELAAHESILAD